MRHSGTLPHVDGALTYRGRTLTSADVAFIRALIAAHPRASRRALSRQLCEAWQWTQPNGALCDAICRGVLLWLHRAGHIALPARALGAGPARAPPPPARRDRHEPALGPPSRPSL